MPHDPETYLHRIGRTGRFGTSVVCNSLLSAHLRFKGTLGVAISFVDKQELDIVKRIVETFHTTIDPLPENIPPELYSYELTSEKDKRALKRLEVTRETQKDNALRPVSASEFEGAPRKKQRQATEEVQPTTTATTTTGKQVKRGENVEEEVLEDAVEGAEYEEEEVVVAAEEEANEGLADYDEEEEGGADDAAVDGEGVAGEGAWWDPQQQWPANFSHWSQAPPPVLAAYPPGSPGFVQASAWFWAGYGYAMRAARQYLAELEQHQQQQQQQEQQQQQ